MIDKLLTLWTEFGVRVMSGYMIFIEKVGAISVIAIPFVLLGFTIPWILVMVVLLALDILYGRIVYDLPIKEQVGWFMDGIKEGYHGNGDH